MLPREKSRRSLYSYPIFYFHQNFVSFKETFDKYTPFLSTKFLTLILIAFDMRK